MINTIFHLKDAATRRIALNVEDDLLKEDQESQDTTSSESVQEENTKTGRHDDKENECKDEKIPIKSENHYFGDSRRVHINNHHDHYMKPSSHRYTTVPCLHDPTADRYEANHFSLPMEIPACSSRYKKDINHVTRDTTKRTRNPRLLVSDYVPHSLREESRACLQQLRDDKLSYPTHDNKIIYSVLENQHVDKPFCSLYRKEYNPKLPSSTKSLPNKLLKKNQPTTNLNSKKVIYQPSASTIIIEKHRKK